MPFKETRPLLLLTMATLAVPAIAGERFVPPGCDFEVTFPGTYETKELTVPSGQTTVLAKSPNGQPLKLSAECWPLQPITPQAYAKAIGPKMAERGIKVHNVSVGKQASGDVVTLVGVAGDGRDAYQMRFESYFGPKTRLDLLILEQATTPSDGHLAFRNSVKLR